MPKKLEQKIIYSETAMGELNEISSHTRNFLAYVVEKMEQGSDLTGTQEQAQEMEDKVDDLESGLRNHHITRLNTGEGAVLPGLIFIDMLHNFEKIGDHTFNLSEALVGKK